VTSQLVYEIAGPQYANPDVTALFDTIQLAPAGPDRVTISGVRGAPAPEKLKVAVNLFAGFRNTMSLVLTGRDAAAKADLALRMVAGVGLADALGDPADGRPAPSPRELARASSLEVSALHVAFEDVAAQDPATTAAAQGHLRITVKDLEQRKVGKPFTTAVVESALGCYPGMFPTAPPAEGSAYGIYWPTLIDRSEVQVAVTVDSEPVDLGSAGEGHVAPMGASGAGPQAAGVAGGGPQASGDPAADGPAAGFAYIEGTVLGDVVGARSGDKGGNANVGVWIPEPGVGPSAGLSADDVAARYAWLEGWLTADKVRELLPEAVWQRCYVHFLRNALDYLPRKADDDCRQELRWLYDRRNLKEAQQDLQAWLKRWEKRYPKLTDWVEAHICETLNFYSLPRQHHKHLKSTNMLERLNEEIKRRTRVVRIFPNAASCL
jgi:hypothetical protein